MDQKYFSPSDQLTGAAFNASGGGRFQGNYRGDSSLAANKGTHVPEESNTSLWITKLPASTTIPALLAAITKTGKVRSAVVNGPTEGRSTAAASLSFFRREDAETLYRAGQRGSFRVCGTAPQVFWNRNRVAGDGPPEASRVILVAGDPDVVSPEALTAYFSTKFVFDVDTIIDHGTVPGYGGPIARCEYRFGSWRGQAVFAYLAITRELQGRVLVEYGADPCE
ncbi:hypothetical protein GGS23DRAFT_596034 [Durotheca rogersii]|uniref:uncharacterized protein n=1 Tax=Durotheca rogersii TaxID=419775 RepID=UPI00221E63AE|nr:uncharacterized protein GGS23DRAFT_596034 [Durotheca rogersii]KAI5864400.1 hypothetical protein GGS23DRAFT_596034 [Durotheca rogersii]